jgi:hypothetical protein
MFFATLACRQMGKIVSGAFEVALAEIEECDNKK